jgi:hypothetical protein
MRDNTWTRDHDHLIAKNIEGLSFIERGMAGGPELPEPPHYNTDLLACYRAAEAWRKGGEQRRYILRSSVDWPSCCVEKFRSKPAWAQLLDDAGPSASDSGATITEAFARALYQLAERTEM